MSAISGHLGIGWTTAHRSLAVRARRCPKTEERLIRAPVTSPICPAISRQLDGGAYLGTNLRRGGRARLRMDDTNGKGSRR